MARQIVLLSGPVASGKSTLVTKLADTFEAHVVKTRDLMASRLRVINRATLQRRGDRLDRETNGRWVLDGLERRLRDLPHSSLVIVDAVRKAYQIEAIREAYGANVTHIHLTAPLEVLASRHAQRQNAGEPDYATVRRNRTERSVETLSAFADIVIDTNRCTEEDVLTRAASHLKLFQRTNSGYVDVIVGGQYGSEGKGQIAAYLAKEYDLLVRVGGPNAGHKVFEIPAPYTHHQLPSGTRRVSETKLLIGPGAVLNVESLMKEIADCSVDVDRLCIDKHAMIISSQDRDDEQGLVRGIGSTGQSVGAATARRIMERSPHTILAKDIPDLKPYICDAPEVLDATFASNGRVCLEGTQGTGLSLYHGYYPFVTSRDTTAAGCIAEAGIPPSKVRRVVMVCRTYPIRVQSPEGATSGPMSQEISLETISQRSGVDLAQLAQTERTSTTDRPRRIGEFDWAFLRKASLLNNPTDIALTFTDYLTVANQQAKRFEQLHPETINFIEEIERVSGAHVSLIATGFNLRSIIDRRNW